MEERTQPNSVPQPASVGERCFTVVFLVLLTGAFVNLILTPEQILDPGEGMAGARYMWAAVYAGALLYGHRYCRGSLKLLLNERPILLLVLLAIVSVIWSDSPATTFRRSIALVGTCLIALYFAARFKIREQLQLLGWAFGLCMIFSWVFGWLHLGRSVDDLEGAWYGIYTQKNELGAMMVLSVLLFVLWGQVRPRTRWVSWICAAASFALIVASSSVTALIALFVLLFAIPMIWVLRNSNRPGMLILISVIVVVGIALWAGVSLETATQAVGKDPTLTGRTDLWATSILMGLQRPWLGFGYSAFWLGANGQSAEVWRIVGWAVPSAHNGLLEIWLDLGAVGVLIAVFGFGRYLRKAIWLIRCTRTWEYAWPLLFLVFLFVLNLTASTFFGGNNIYWFLYVVIALNLSRFQSAAARIQPEAAPC